MIKKLDKLILKAFVGPFIATFFITLFMLVMQIIWKYIDDLVGKGLDFFTLIRFTVYASATLVTLALPIAILLSSIMTFGKLGETFELVAIKSAGISLLRFMRPIFFVSIVLCFITFLFANYVIPVAKLKFAVIYNDIYRKSPAFDLKDGVFYNGFKGYSIKIGKKEKDSILNNALIYEQSYGPQDNSIIAQKGIMKMSEDKKFLEFKLQNGTRYQEKGDLTTNNNEFIRLSFKEYNKLFDLSQLDIQKTQDSLFKNNLEMETLRQLDRTMDSLNKKPDSFANRTKLEMNIYMNYFKYKDTIKNFVKPAKFKAKKFDDLVPDSLKSIVNNNALNTISNMRNTTQLTISDYKNHSKTIMIILLEWHRKFALSFACLALFFIGAPIGSIIRKGGLGLPIIMALLFFTIFHLLNTFGEKLVKQEVLTPMTGMWLSIIGLAPIGAFLTYKATRDSQLLNKEFYYRSFKTIYRFCKPVLSIFKKENQSS